MFLTIDDLDEWRYNDVNRLHFEPMSSTSAKTQVVMAKCTGGVGAELEAKWGDQLPSPKGEGLTVTGVRSSAHVD